MVVVGSGGGPVRTVSDAADLERMRLPLPLAEDVKEERRNFVGGSDSGMWRWGGWC